MELKKGETFVSLLNIHGGDNSVVPTHLVLKTKGKQINDLYYF
jgi:hypothetical protein